MNMKYNIIAVLIALVLPTLLHGQSDSNISARISIDSTQILVGDQTRLHIELSHDKRTNVSLPLFIDTLTAGIEVLESLKPDTTILSDERIQINQDLLITSFDEGIYHISPIAFSTEKGDTIYSNGLGLKVVTFPVDTVNIQYFDIKPVITPQFVWGDYHLYVVLALGILFLIFAAIYLYKLYKNKQSIIGLFVKEEPKLPPHIAAFNALEQIKKEKIWQNGMEKEYYTQITEVLRVYMEDRFNVNAMEMTSHEILEQIRRNPEAKEVFDQLKQILELSDFVKFAKWKPTIHENESSIMQAIFFVEKTQPEEVNKPTEEVESSDNKKEKSE